MDTKYVIPNLRNACRVLKALSRTDAAYSLSELADRLEIPRTTALRILRTLELEGFVRRDDAAYRLGSGLVHVGLQALAGVDLRAAAVPVLRELADATGETAHLAVLSDDRSLILEVCDSPHPLRVASRPGSLAQLHCSATGKVFLAWCLAGRLREVLDDAALERRTPRTLATLEALEADAAAVRARGWALDDEEFFDGVRCLAAPVWSARQEVVAALGITGTTTRFTPEKVESYAAIVTAAARRLSGQLGAPRG